ELQLDQIRIAFLEKIKTFQAISKSNVAVGFLESVSDGHRQARVAGIDAEIFDVPAEVLEIPGEPVGSVPGVEDAVISTDVVRESERFVAHVSLQQIVEREIMKLDALIIGGLRHHPPVYFGEIDLFFEHGSQDPLGCDGDETDVQ